MGSKKEIKIPAPCEKLAEFLGIFLGDGSVSSDYQVSISFNYQSEQLYASYVAGLIRELFGLTCARRIRPKHGCGDIIVNSGALVEFLFSQNIKKGDKIRGNSSLPAWVFETKETQTASARGLFDTDGCVYLHRYNAGSTIYYYPKLAFTGYSAIIRKQFFDLLILMGFRPREYGMRVHLYSQDEVIRYFHEVGTHNMWHQARFEKFCKDRELERFFTLVS